MPIVKQHKRTKHKKKVVYLSALDNMLNKEIEKSKVFRAKADVRHDYEMSKFMLGYISALKDIKIKMHDKLMRRT